MFLYSTRSRKRAKKWKFFQRTECKQNFECSEKIKGIEKSFTDTLVVNFETYPYCMLDFLDDKSFNPDFDWLTGDIGINLDCFDMIGCCGLVS